MFDCEFTSTTRCSQRSMKQNQRGLLSLPRARPCQTSSTTTRPVTRRRGRGSEPPARAAPPKQNQRGPSASREPVRVRRARRRHDVCRARRGRGSEHHCTRRARRSRSSARHGTACESAAAARESTRETATATHGWRTRTVGPVSMATAPGALARCGKVRERREAGPQSNFPGRAYYNCSCANGFEWADAADVRTSHLSAAGPACKCGKASVQKRVKKDGPTKGRPFWCCARGSEKEGVAALLRMAGAK